MENIACYCEGERGNIQGDIPAPCGAVCGAQMLYYIKILQIKYLDKKVTMKCFVARLPARGLDQERLHKIFHCGSLSCEPVNDFLCPLRPLQTFHFELDNNVIAKRSTLLLSSPGAQLLVAIFRSVTTPKILNRIVYLSIFTMSQIEALLKFILKIILLC